MTLIAMGRKKAHRSADANEAAGDGVLQLVLLSKEGNDARVDGHAGRPPLRILGHNAWPNLYFLPHLQHPLRHTRKLN